VLLCQRHCDVHFSANQLQLGKTNTLIDDRVAVRADRDKVPYFLVHTLTVSHATVWHFGGATLDAIDFTWLAWPLIFRPP
jgi:hypothetical protein